MEVVRLKPFCTDYIWGGNKFKSWGKQSNKPIIAECWELSFHKDGACLIDSGINKGFKLKDLATKQDIGKIAAEFEFFPILVKLIDARENLSVQVHPSDEYALKNENQFGKTEMWYVLENEPGACLYVGFNKDVSKEEVERRILDGSIIDILNKIEVKPGESYFIPSGTIHAIGKGVTVLEIQQNSNLTYRVFDYGRVGKDGKQRELHIDKALKVLNFKKYVPNKDTSSCLAKCRYFSSYVSDEQTLNASENSFVTLIVIKGNGKVNNIPATKGTTFFIPAGKSVNIDGDIQYVYSLVE